MQGTENSGTRDEDMEQQGERRREDEEVQWDGMKWYAGRRTYVMKQEEEPKQTEEWKARLKQQKDSVLLICVNKLHLARWNKRNKKGNDSVGSVNLVGQDGEQFRESEQTFEEYVQEEMVEEIITMHEPTFIVFNVEKKLEKKDLEKREN